MKIKYISREIQNVLQKTLISGKKDHEVVFIEWGEFSLLESCLNKTESFGFLGHEVTVDKVDHSEIILEGNDSVLFVYPYPELNRGVMELFFADKTGPVYSEDLRA